MRLTESGDAENPQQAVGQMDRRGHAERDFSQVWRDALTGVIKVGGVLALL